MMLNALKPSRRLVAACAAVALFAGTNVHAAATTVREPAWGLPHIFADTDLELARENGYQIARDRLAQMILLGRAGRGTLAQAFGVLDPSFFDSDVEQRTAGYTSSEYQKMFEKLPPAAQAYIVKYCDGVNDRIQELYSSPPSGLPVEITVLKGIPLNTLGNDLFGNATNLSDQVDPYYKAPGGADPLRPQGGYQFTPEIALAIAVIQVRNFGLNTFEEEDRLVELLALQGLHGNSDGEDIWHDYNFLVDPLAPVSVPTPDSPGYGGPLSKAKTGDDVLVADAGLAGKVARWKGKDWKASAEQIAARASQREELLSRWSAWPKLGSYAWLISADRSASGHPWLGGFPQTGIQTPSLMHYVENRSGEGISGNGMEFVGGAYVLIGHTDTVAYTTTTAQLRIIDSFFEEVVNENTDAVRYNDEGTSAPMNKRTEVIIMGGAPATPISRTFWRTHERGGNGGSRSVMDFVADAEGTAESGTTTTLVDTGATFAPALIGGYVLITGGTGAGQIRLISGASGNTLTVSTPFTTSPGSTSVYVAAESGNTITAVAYDSGAWMEESTTAYAFSLFQKATDVMDMREAVRLIPSTHNFFAADNQAFVGHGTAASYGNIGYWSSGYSRKRQDSSDELLPIDGTGPNPLVVAEGTLTGATATSITDGLASFSNFEPDDVNNRYDNPDDEGEEYIISIISGTGGKQTRRIASTDSSTSLTVEYPFGAVPAAGDRYEIYEIVGIPEVINPTEGYIANWNNKASRSDIGDNFGREHRVAFILERLAADSSWTRDEQRQLNKELAGLDGRGSFARHIVPRIREAVDAIGDGGNPNVGTVLAALETFNATPDFARYFNDPVTATTTAGENAFLNTFINELADTIYGDELAPIGTPTGSRAQALVTHAIDSARALPVNAYAQEYGGDYFNGSDWKTVVRDTFSTLANGGIPADGARPNSNYNHPLAGLNSALSFTPTPQGNRGTWEQIVESGPTVKGEFMFPLGQSGEIKGTFTALPLALTVRTIDPNVTSIQPIWRDWRFLPMLHVAEDIEAGDEDSDADGVYDAFENWHFGVLTGDAEENADGDKSELLSEFLNGSDPTDADTDDDGLVDGFDGRDQDRLGSGFQKFKGQVKLNNPDDSASVKGKFGTGGLTFDPLTDSIDIAIDNIEGEPIYEATLPAGTLTAKGTKYYIKDPDGVNDGIALFQIKLGTAPDKPGSVKMKTVKMDLTVPSGGPIIQVTISINDASTGTSHALLDARIWEPSGSTLKSTDITKIPIYH